MRLRVSLMNPDDTQAASIELGDERYVLLFARTDATMKQYRIEAAPEHYRVLFPEYARSGVDQVEWATKMIAEPFSTTRTKVVIFSHSDVFLNVLRLEVAAGRLEPSDVAIIYATGDELIRITPDKAGGLSKWPRGFFDTTLDQMAAILRARRDSSPVPNTAL